MASCSHYTEEGRPEGLCKAKRLVYITTSGGPCSFANYGFEYLQGIAHMFGIPETHFISAELLRCDRIKMSMRS